MRTTLTLDDALVAQAKELAARTGRTLSAVVEDSLRQALARVEVPEAKAPVELPVFVPDAAGVQPGIDLDDSASLWDLMEADDPPL